ncbi:hypothetical protein SSAG_01175 [Streptomyces sp. Mg1]|nr:hypothetical protein SSAG_01175 [Streptomyces sp. Mg1]
MAPVRFSAGSVPWQPPCQDNGTQLPTVMRDPRWPAEGGWVKMEMKVKEVEVHYVYNRQTMEAADFKFKDRSAP